MGMVRRRILIDGYNMSMPTGTGIATYARGLATIAHALGNDVGILYGPPSVPADPLLREMTFFEPPATVRMPGTLGATLRRFRQFIDSRRQMTASPIVLDSLVSTRAIQDRLPVHNRLWAIPNVFELAQVHYFVTGRFLEIAIPETPDIVHWTYTMPIRVIGAKNVYTIHDMVPFLLPDATRVDKRRFLALTRQIAAQADHIITVSEHSKHDIIRLLGISEDRVSNTYQSIDLPAEAIGRPLGRIRYEIEQGQGLPFGEYFLYFGAIEPKKNVTRLIRGYLQSGVRCPLAIVGKLAWDSDVEARLLSDPALRYTPPLDATPQIRRGLKHVDYTTRDSLVSLIRGAKAVLFPSLYEGFGLPALEAMLLGTPVLASTEGALPEVCGDAALLVDPYDIGALADGIRRLDGDPALRGSLSDQGRRQALRFSPGSYAARMEALYQRLAGPEL
jgi:glycosyltransferase involved in cell wall biosynthesis